MRIISKDRHHFRGTHKGAIIEIEREKGGRFYICVFNDAGYCYDGYAPKEIRKMADAKREAIRGSCL